MQSRVIATVAIGDKGHQWVDLSAPFMRRYAQRCGADFFCLTTGLEGIRPTYAKFKLGSLLDRYDRLAFIDADILVSPDAPDIFAEVPAGMVGATRIDRLSAAESPLVRSGSIGREMALAGNLFGPFEWDGCYFNAGCMLFERRHRAVFDKCLESLDRWNAISTRSSDAVHTVFADQTLFNHWTQALGFAVHDLGPGFNHTRPFNHRRHRYLSHFYHYAGDRAHRRGDRMRQMRLDAAVLRRPSLHELLRRNVALAKLLDRL